MKTPISAYLLAKNNLNYDGEGAWHWREPLDTDNGIERHVINVMRYEDGTCEASIHADGIHRTFAPRYMEELADAASNAGSGFVLNTNQ